MGSGALLTILFSLPIFASAVLMVLARAGASAFSEPRSRQTLMALAAFGVAAWATSALGAILEGPVAAAISNAVFIMAALFAYGLVNVARHSGRLAFAFGATVSVLVVQGVYLGFGAVGEPMSWTPAGLAVGQLGFSALCVAAAHRLVTGWPAAKPLEIGLACVTLAAASMSGWIAWRMFQSGDSAQAAILSAVAVVVSLAVGALAKLLSATLTPPQLTGALDRLTGLPSPNAFESALNARSDPLPPGTALALIDLDRFSIVSNTIGRNVADRFIALVARCLSDLAPPEASLWRVSIDAFVAILPPLVDQEAFCTEALCAVRSVDPGGGRALQVRASIGVATSPIDGQTPRDLMSAAEVALGVAKSRGGDRHVAHEPNMRLQIEGRARLESALREAIEGETLTLHFQPKIAAATGQLAGCEALLRWRRGDESVSPKEFIPVAEESGLIRPLGRLVLRMGARQAAAWAADHRPCRVAVNVSRLELEDPDYIGQVKAMLANGDIDPARLEFEITESAMANDHAAIGAAHALRALGFRVAIDDFGAGASTLAQLSRMPVDCLKIDRSFLVNLDHDEKLVAMILDYAKEAGLETVAEGVETEAQAGWLRRHGCTTFQGFLFDPALPAALFAQRYLRRASNVTSLQG